MARQSAAGEAVGPRMKLVQATLDLLRQSGLTGAGINQVVDRSRAPKGSLYHYFPGGKQELVTEALREADRAVGGAFDAIFRTDVGTGDKVRTLFAKTAAGIEANAFTKGCPVAAVTLDLDEESEPLRQACRDVFGHWVDLIAQGLEELPARERHAVAQLIVATLEGALILARASGSKAPLTDAGAELALMAESRPPGRRRRRVSRSR